ncbi:MAG: 1-deoxy-D-xylulose 5-phosphate reductoisomerase [Steroidobacteraceae bacterium]|nr:1-deoxy-D-xylulose 5-phosphate reductoisomerase [Steroidobacteraceae bacterium]
MKGLAILGATGSVGLSTLDVAARHPDRFRVVALGAQRSAAALREQALRFRPDVVALADPGAARELAADFAQAGIATRVLAGSDALSTLATLPEVDFVMAAIVGAAGLPSTLAAARAGKRVLLANKESLVMAGPLLMRAVAEGGATLIPIDSEHNAIFQCLPHAAGGRAGVRRVVLTASGGPFRNRPRETFRDITPEEACAHPVWSMGRKISVDSATLMNKGLEFIEACHLFGLDPVQVVVVLHPQSIVHSLVEYADGSLLAQLGAPDMRTPIACALAWPERIASGVEFLDLVKVARLDFGEPDLERFPCLALGQAAARAGGLVPAAVNAANEVAVAGFLAGRLNFTGIAEVIESVMNKVTGGPIGSIDDVLRADREARARALEALP